ncbi:MAG: hemolysin family protein [Planctomycetes bacterium]|nr:hemolysin family protein [Planctomycetota bacterium]
MATAILSLIAFLLSWASMSLREFSRSRLEEICRRRGRPDRFGQILKQHETAQRSLDIALALVVPALAAVVVVWRMLDRSAPHGPWQVVLAVLEAAGFVVALVALVAAVPWSVSRVAGESYLDRVWPLVRFLRMLLAPLETLAAAIDKFVHRLSGVPQEVETDAAAFAEEIMSVVDEGRREGVLESQAGTMIQRVIELQEEDVRAVMTPRTEMHTIPADATLEEARDALLEHGHSRLPVIGETTDDIVGILYAKDLLRCMNGENGPEFSLKDLVREPVYVPETAGIDTLLERMKREHVHIAIVIDEYSGVAGLVTMEDILEEIVGEIADEYDPHVEEEPIQMIAPGVLEVESRVHIDDLNEEFGLELPEDEDYDTIGGFVFSQLGRVPRPRESFTWGKLAVTVLSAGKRKIHRLRIEIVESPVATSTEG